MTAEITKKDQEAIKPIVLESIFEKMAKIKIDIVNSHTSENEKQLKDQIWLALNAITQSTACELSQLNERFGAQVNILTQFATQIQEHCNGRRVSLERAAALHAPILPTIEGQVEETRNQSVGVKTQHAFPQILATL